MVENPVETEARLDAPPGECLVYTQGLEKTYYSPGGEVRALRGVDLALRQGEMVAVVGASGVGKSTLLHVLGALDRPTRGEVYFQGEPLFTRSDKDLARFRNQSLGFIFQFHHLLPEFSALENVMMPGLMSGESRQKVRQKAALLIERVGLEKRSHHRPTELSGGEQQRVAIARALMNGPSLVLADEPTGNLDSETAESIIGLLKELNTEEKMTYLIATHNLAFAERLHRVVVMKDGKVATSR